MTVAVLGEGIVDLIQDNEGAYRPHLGGSPYNVATALARYEETVFFCRPSPATASAISCIQV